MPNWTAPQRTDPPFIADERVMLETWLDYQRDTLLFKCAGLTGEQLCERACPPSSLSLLGLVRHMADVERGWFQGRWRGTVPPIFWSTDNQDGDFDDTDPALADDDLDVYRREVAAAREEAARHSLDDVVIRSRPGGGQDTISLRWIYVHMIEEYARHNGHADLLRERIDGETGD